MTEQLWRLDPIGNGTLAWLYVKPYAVHIDEPAKTTTRTGVHHHPKTQSLVDDQLSGCLRYLAIKLN